MGSFGRVLIVCAAVAASGRPAGGEQRARRPPVQLRLEARVVIGTATVASVDAALAALSTRRELVACAARRGPRAADAPAIRLLVEVTAGEVSWVGTRRDGGDAELTRCLERGLVGTRAPLVGARGRSYVDVAVAVEPWRRGRRRAPAPRVIAGRATAMGSLDKEIIRRVIRARQPELLICFQQLAGPLPDRARLVMAFTIAPGGRVKAARVVSGSVSAPAVQRCVARQLQGWRFPRASGGGVVQVRVPLRLALPHVAPRWRFRPLPLPPLLADGVTAIAEAPDGRLLLGTDGRGLHLFDGASVVEAPWRFDRSARVRAVVDLGQGARAVLSDRGVLLVAGRRGRLLGGVAARSAARGAGGTIWIGSDEGLYRLAKGRLEPVAAVDRSWRIDSVAVIGDHVWYLSRGNLRRHRPRGVPAAPAKRGKGAPASAPAARPASPFEAVAADVGGIGRDARGRVWRSGRGLTLLGAGKRRHHLAVPCAAQARRFVEDRAGALWLITADHGLARFDRLTHRCWRADPASGLLGAKVRDLLATAAGGLVVATSAGLFQLVAPRLRRASGALWGEEIYQLLRARDGRLLSADLPDMHWLEDARGVLHLADGARLWRIGGGGGSPLLHLQGERAATINAAVFAADGGVLLGTDGGLLAWSGKGAPRPVSTAPAHGPVVAMARQRAGARSAVWFGGPHGLWSMSEGGRARRERDEPLRQLAVAEGTLAAATARGLLVRRGGRFSRWTSDHGLFGDDVRAVAILPDGTVVAATAGGINFLRHGAPPVQSLTRSDGLPAASISALWADPDGALWAGTRGSGLWEVRRLASAPRVGLADVRVDGEALPRSRDGAPLALSWTAKTLTLSAVGASWTDRRENLVFELEARRDGQRVLQRTSRAATVDLPLAELGSGRVEISVRARGVDGAASTAATLVIERVAPPWRRPLWLLGLLLLTLGAAAATRFGPRLYRLRLAPALALRGARRELAGAPSAERAVELALALYRRFGRGAIALLRRLAARPELRETATGTWLRAFELLGRDPEAGLRMLRARAAASSSAGAGWPAALDWLGAVLFAPALEAAAVARPAATPAARPLDGLAETLGALRLYREETNVGKRWDYLRGAHDYLAELMQLAPAELPRPLDGAFVAVAGELRRRVGIELRDADWREQGANARGSLDSRKLRFVVENEYPHPVAVPFSRLREAADPAGLVPLLGGLLEALVSFLAAALAPEALAGTGDKLRRELRQRLLRGAPSAGDWLALARCAAATVRAAAGRTALDGLLPLFAGECQKKLDEVVERRNRLIHRRVGVTRADTQELQRDLESLLWTASALRETKLVVATKAEEVSGVKRYTVRALHGFQEAFEAYALEANVALPLAAPLLVNREARRVVDLRPLLIWASCPECPRQHLFCLGRVAGKYVEYVSVAQGHALRAREALAELQGWLEGSDDRARVHDVDLLAVDALDEQRRQLPGGYVLHYESGVQIERQIGSGGFADVYLARRLDDERPLAVKVLPYQYLRDPTLVRRFRREADASRRLEHPHVVRVFGHGDDVGDHFILMELATGWEVDGERVRDVESLPKPLPPPQAVDVIRQALDGLAHVHGQGIVHRDIKPANLLLFEGGAVKITDFGTARTRESMNLTRTGMLMATPEYMSPEQAAGSGADLSSDLYSLGVVMYELLAGELPFSGDTPIAVAIARLRAEPRPLSKACPRISKQLAAFVHRLIARDPADRFSTAVEALAALDACA